MITLLKRAFWLPLIAAMLAANCHAGNYAGRWVVVVDEDIDPSTQALLQNWFWGVLS